MGGLLLREDRNFHTIQAIEAAFRQYARLRGTTVGAHVLVAAARYLAAHSPTMRSRDRPTISPAASLGVRSSTKNEQHRFPVSLVVGRLGAYLEDLGRLWEGVEIPCWHRRCSIANLSCGHPESMHTSRSALYSALSPSGSPTDRTRLSARARERSNSRKHLSLSRTSFVTSTPRVTGSNSLGRTEPFRKESRGPAPVTILEVVETHTDLEDALIEETDAP